MSEKSEKKSHEELLEFRLGGVVPGGTADEYTTGGWRKLCPTVDKDKCTNCLICWMVCPDSAVIVEDGKMVGFELEHCKGCGICAMECPDKVQAIKMEEEEAE